MKDRQKVVEFIALKMLESMSYNELTRFYLNQTKESLKDETDEELTDYLDNYCVHEDGSLNNEEYTKYADYLDV